VKRLLIILTLIFVGYLVSAQPCCDTDQKIQLCYMPASEYCVFDTCKYTFDARFMEGLRLKINNVANFGPSGIADCEVVPVPLVDIESKEDIDLLNCNIVLLGSFAEDNGAGYGTTISDRLLRDIHTWSTECQENLAILFQGESHIWGYEVKDNNVNPNKPIGNTTLNIFNGLFGEIESFSQGGTFQAYFSGLPLSGATILAVDALQRPTIVLDESTNDIIMSDVGIMCNNVGDVTISPDIETNNDILVCNTIALACDIARSSNSTDQFVKICSGESYVLPSGELVSTEEVHVSVLENISGCDSIVYTHLTLGALPELVIADYNDTYCGESNGSVQLNALNGNGPYMYSLDSLKNQTGIFDTLAPGSYVAYVEDISECQNDESFNINGSENVSLALAAEDGVCGELGKISLFATGGNGSYEYSNDNQLYSTLSTLNNLEAGDYTFYLRDSEGCLDSVTQSIELYTVPELSEVVSPDYCEEGVGRVELVGSGGQGILDYRLKGESSSALPIYEKMSAGSYTFIVTDEGGCSSTKEVVIESTPPVRIDDLNAKQLFCGDVLSEVRFTPIGGTGVLSYTVTDVAGNEVDVTEGLTEGQYRLVVTDVLNCTVVETILVRKEECTIYIPTTFNPLDNGEDKSFKLGVPDASNFLIESFRIFDRWGNLVYNEEDIDPLTFTDWWDGTYNGKDVERPRNCNSVAIAGRLFTIKS